MNWTCLNTEERLSEFLDGALAANEAAELSVHLGSCTRCRDLVAGVRSTIARLHAVELLPEPPGLADQIIEATLGPRPKKHRWPGWLGWLQPVMQPRFAMGLATAALAFFFTAEALGVEWKKVEVSDLNPVNLYHASERRVHLLFARGVKFVNDLQVVSEIQSRLQPASEQEARPEEPAKKPKEDPKRSRESNELNSPKMKAPMLALVLGGLPGGNRR